MSEEDLVKCECCDELFSRGAYSEHWRQQYAWQDTPIWYVLDAHWANRFYRAGFGTVGSVYYATPETLARSIDQVGPKRAVSLRQTVVDYVQGRPRMTLPYVVVEGHEDPIVELAPSVWDALLTVAALAAVGLIGTLTIWWLLQ